jgi:hypothetical protein
VGNAFPVRPSSSDVGFSVCGDRGDDRGGHGGGAGQGESVEAGLSYTESDSVSGGEGEGEGDNSGRRERIQKESRAIKHNRRDRLDPYIIYLCGNLKDYERHSHVCIVINCVSGVCHWGMYITVRVH